MRRRIKKPERYVVCAHYVKECEFTKTVGAIEFIAPRGDNESYKNFLDRIRKEIDEDPERPLGSTGIIYSVNKL